MKISLKNLLAIGLAAFLTAAPALADAKQKRYDERSFSRGDRHEYRQERHREHKRHQNDKYYYHDRRYYGRDHAPRPTFYYHRHYKPRHYDHGHHHDSYIKWIGGAILLHELLHYHDGRVCYVHH